VTFERRITIVLSFAWCAWKGAILWLFRPEQKPGPPLMWADAWGWDDPLLAPAWARVAVSADSHNLTNLSVEWVRMNPQRGAKLIMGCGVIFGVSLVTLACIVGLLVWQI
jgi:hypothetical protein